MPATTPSSRPTTPLGRALRRALLAGALAAAPLASADTFLITDIIDAIPAPVGSLRWAIEQSELNGEPDRILFLIDGGTIELVAPLPDLLEGSLSIADGPDISPAAGPLPSPGIFVSGRGIVPRAIAIRSPGNRIEELQFVDFAGTEVILVAGGGAVSGNTIARCVFGRDGLGSANTGAGIRIANDPLGSGTPSGTGIYRSRFVNNDFGVVIDGDASSPGLNGSGTEIAWNGFGTTTGGAPGAGTGRAISAVNGGPVRIVGNRFSGPGTGILLGAGTSRSEVSGNVIGIAVDGAAACSGYSGPAVEADGGRVTIEENTVACSQTGLLLGGQADAAVRRNTIGGEAPAGHASHGIALSAAAEAVIELNSIVGNGGYGVAIVPDQVGTPNDGPLITCNAISRNALGALELPNVTTLAPILTGATPILVEGQTMSVAGWAEIFGDGTDQARVFQGAVRPGSVDPPLRHLVPVLDLRVVKGAGGASISFDRGTPAVHTATFTAEATLATSELSAPIAADDSDLVYDLVRGNVGNLGFLSTSTGIDLGPVTCLAAGLDPDIVISPNVIDPLDPLPGESFFYVSRRREQTANRPGTYDPAICLTHVDRFGGPRRPSSGDCP